MIGLFKNAVVNDESNSPTFPDVVLEKIFEKLKIRDRARMRRVCKLWNQILTRVDVLERPWLIDRDINFCSFLSEINFYSWSAEGQKRHCFKLPELYGGINGGRFCGTSAGWLLLAAGPDSDPCHVFLWNPLLGTTRKLPSLCTLPFLDQLSGSESKKVTINPWNFIKLVEIFQVGRQEHVAAVVFSGPKRGEDDYLVMSTPQEKEWRILSVNGDCFHSYEDILFHKGKLYALAKYYQDYQDEEEEEYTIQLSIQSSECTVKVCVLSLDKYKPNKHSQSLSGPTFGATFRNRFVSHLVESSTSGQELLVVTAIYDSYVYNGLEEKLEYEQTGSFEIRTVKGSNVISETGDQTIYIGSGTSSVSIPTTAHFDHSPERSYGNGIMFSTDDARALVGNDKRHFCRENGSIYDIRHDHDPPNKRFDYMRLLPLGQGQCPKIGWFTPKLF